MTDDAQDNDSEARRRTPDEVAKPTRARGRRAASGSSSEPAATPPAGDDASLEALERLQALAPGAPVASQSPEAARLAPLRTSDTARGQLRPRTRPAAAPGTGRIAAPVVFLAAIIILLSITFQSGILGGAHESAVTPTPTVTKTKGANATSATTRKYVVKRGDTLSAIAVRFNTTSSVIEDLNPDMSASTVVVGQKIIVPLK